MSLNRRYTARTLLVGATCAAAGVGAGAIATAGAATTTPTSHPAAAHALRARRVGLLRRFAARGVQGDVVVRTASGFATVSFARGTVDSVNGQQLTLTEGTPKATYKTVTETIPVTARVRDNGKRATLSQLQHGQRVVVVRAPRRTVVVAHTPKAG